VYGETPPALAHWKETNCPISTDAVEELVEALRGDGVPKVTVFEEELDWELPPPHPTHWSVVTR
jgi:hypothetical protein